MRKTTALLLAAAMVIACLPAVSLAAGLEDGLVLRYTFDSDGSAPSVIEDVTGHGYNGTVLNTSQQVGGRPGQQAQTYTKNLTIDNGAAVFPGIESVRSGRNNVIVNGAAIKIPEEARGGLEDYTMSMWVMADSGYSYGSQYQRFFDFGIATDNSIFLRYRASDGELRFQDRGIGSGKDDARSYVQASGTNAKINDKWALLTVTYEKAAKALTVYLNGEAILSDSGKFNRSIGDVPTLSNGTYGMYLGRTMWYGEAMSENPDFKGKMDDVRIYGRALSAGEAMELYKTTNPEGDKTIVSVTQPDDVYTLVGVAPALPSAVKALLGNNSVENAEVEWESISPDKYASVGEFTVTGTLKGTSVTVEVTVHVVDDPEQSIKSGMVANYTFDEDAARPETIRDMSGSGNDAQVLNTVGGDWFSSVDNRLTVENGWAIFPGCTLSQSWFGNQMNTGAALRLPKDINQGLDSYTVSMWVNADSGYQYGDKYQRLFDFGNISGDRDDSIYAAYFVQTSDLHVYDYRDDIRAGEKWKSDDFTDKWGMLTVAYDGAAKTATVYVNAKELGTIEMPRGLSGLGSLTDESNGLYIGRNVWMYGNYINDNPDFKGKMDNIRIYNRSLSGDEVKAVYEATNPNEEVEIIQNIVVKDADGRDIYSTSRTDRGWKYNRYIAEPEETYIYNDTKYYLLRELSDLEIESVSDDNRTVTIVYTVMTTGLEVTAVADTYTESGSGSGFGGGETLMISSTGGSGAAQRDRYGFFRFPGTDGAVFGGKLRVFVEKIDNWAYTTYTLHAIDDAQAMWDENSLNWAGQEAVTANSAVIATASMDASEKDVWLEFDIGDYLRSNMGKQYYSFYITCDTCATYVSSREKGENPPTLSYLTEGCEVTVNYASGGAELLTETVAAPKGRAFDYEARRNIIVKDGKVYTYDTYAGGAHLDTVDEANNLMTINMAETSDYSIDPLTVECYWDSVELPASAVLRAGEYELELPVNYGDTNIDGIGVYDVKGTAEGLEIPVTVKAYGRYYDSKGELRGFASLARVRFVTPEGGKAAETVETEVRTGGTFRVKDMLDYYPQLTGAAVTLEIGGVTEPVHTGEITASVTEGVAAKAGAELTGYDADNYTALVSAAAANTGGTATGALLIAAKYNENGDLVDVKTDSAALPANMTGREELELSVSYDRTAGEDLRFYVWETGAVRPLTAAILASSLDAPDWRNDEELAAMIPAYEDIREEVLRANDYYQSNNSADARTFWDIAAYHTGNMETYFTFGGENYLNYSFDWAKSRNWMGNTRTDLDPSKWTWNYPSGDSNATTDVLHGDWQICFQTFLDLYLVDSGQANISRVNEVMSYQVTKDNDDFWWWADALYMVPPVLTKMYLNTGDEIYLDKLYEYYRFSAELMYDGDCGIPNADEAYTSSAQAKGYVKSSYRTDPESYANLFYRDAGYVYPLNPNSGHESEKNFWARGNGWVFAGLAKILTDLPEDHESYPYFVNLYREMAAAIADCQVVDDQGRGFWTQSMLQNYPTGGNNQWGYETSGTAFFTYGLFWGINSGLLSEGAYIEPALRGWKYLSEVALQSNGNVGYCQQIGSNAANAANASSSYPFGVGAFLLAGCEASRWAGGFEAEAGDQYLKRRLWGAVAASENKLYADGKITDITGFNENGVLYLPVKETAQSFGFSLTIISGTCRLYDSSDGSYKDVENTVTRNGSFYAPAADLAAAMGRHAVARDGFSVISHKTNVFYDCEAGAEQYLANLLNAE